jgi:hypothetical protein
LQTAKIVLETNECFETLNQQVDHVRTTGQPLNPALEGGDSSGCVGLARHVTLHDTPSYEADGQSLASFWLLIAVSP